MKPRHKVAFTEEDDALLMKYIATYNPQVRGRLGMKLYDKLVENAERKWTFSSRHTAHSWRERYKNNQQRFDARILKYQKKHGMSANPSDDPSRAPVNCSSKQTPPARSNLRTNDTGNSIAPVNESGAKKRPREVDPEDGSLDAGVSKKTRREKVSVQGSQPCDPSPHTRTPLEGLRNVEEDRAELPPLPCSVENEVSLAIGSDDYAGALSGSGESDQEAQSLSEGKRVSTPARLSCPSSPANKVEVKPSVAPRKSPVQSPVVASEEPTSSHQQRDYHSETVIVEASGFARKSVVAVQPSQEPTPPHTSAISSPRSPVPRQLSPMSGASTQSGLSPRNLPSASLKRRRILSSPRKRTIIPGEEDDIFSTPPPPPHAVQKHPLPRARGKEAPRLVEGPFRNAYTNANGAPRFMLRGRRASETDVEEEADSENEDWPPRRGKGKLPISSEGPTKQNPTPLRDRKQSNVGAQQHCPSSSLNAFDADPAVESKPTVRMVSAVEPALPNKNTRDSTMLIGQTKAAPLQVAQVASSAVPQTSKATRGPLQPKAAPSLSKDQMLPNSERRPSSHGLVQAKRQAPATNCNRLLFPSVSAHDLPPPAPGPPSKRTSLGQYPNPAVHSDSSVDDPFTVSLVECKARRQTLATEREIPRANVRREKLIRRASVQHIDLRALHSSRSAGMSLIGSGTSGGLSISSDMMKTKQRSRPIRSSTPPNLPESEKKLVLALGLEAVYSRMAENHRFHIDFVREVASRHRSLEEANEVLDNMRKAAGREYARLLGRAKATKSTVENDAEESGAEDQEDVIMSGDEEDDSQLVRPRQAPLDLNLSPTSPMPQGRARRLTLKITRESPDSSPARPPHYSPPTPTRAHEFRRLERQGRVEEARLREVRRVRRSHCPNSADANAEVDEQRIVAYLLQLQENNTDGHPLEKPWDANEAQRLREQIGDEMQEDEGCAGPSISPRPEGHVGADTTQFQGNGSAEELVDASEAIAANEGQAPPEPLLAEGTRRYGSPNRENAARASSSLACSSLAALPLLDAEWMSSDDELLLDGDLTTHEGLVRQKGLGSVKFRAAHLYGFLVDD